MTTNELQIISGGYGIIPTCFFPAEPDGGPLTVREKKADPLLVAVSEVYPVCFAGN